MAYNPSEKLKRNIEAIRVALEWGRGVVPGEEGRAALQSYSGFGGLKAILFGDTSKEEWIRQGASETDQRLYPQVMELYGLLKQYLDEKEYTAAVDSLKNSILTAFYTPPFIPQTLYKALNDCGIQPRNMYEPSAGAGIFITEAIDNLSGLNGVTAVEKDQLTGKILQALCSGLAVPVKVHVSGVEEAPSDDNGQYDLVVSNIPFGNFSVYDPAIQDKALSGKIHNYFFAKGLEKAGDGGLVAYITTDAFLNNPSNEAARKYVFDRADFISLSVLPDNLMKDTGNTEAPTHLLIVQKRDGKQELSVEERLLVTTTPQQNELGPYTLNSYIAVHPELITGNQVTAGTNQYGTINQSVWQKGELSGISEKLSSLLANGFNTRFNSAAFNNLQLTQGLDQADLNRKYTFLPLPAIKTETSFVQLGLFETPTQEPGNKALSYLNDQDREKISEDTARVISTIRTTAEPAHDTFLLLTAKFRNSNRYGYRLHSNTAEIKFSSSWMNASQLNEAIAALSGELKLYGYSYTYEGDQTLEPSFQLSHGSTGKVTDLKPFYKEGTLIISEDRIGYISKPEPDGQGDFHPVDVAAHHRTFFERYIELRDAYLVLAAKEVGGEAVADTEREQLSRYYDAFTSRFGQLNAPFNKKLVSQDSAFGFTILSSLERRDGGQFAKQTYSNNP